MTEAHHRVRNFAVIEIAHSGEPLSPEYISQKLGLPLDEILSILQDLEEHMTFLFRGDGRNVTWAYPVTTDDTPHRVIPGSGETIHAAWAIDALAVPFVQGQLLDENLTYSVITQCGHCQLAITIEIDSELNYRVLERDAEPMIYVPLVDFSELDDPSIIDAFWSKSIFFWSEEHAKAYRNEKDGERGVYLTLAQAVSITPRTQGPLFGLDIG